MNAYNGHTMFFSSRAFIVVQWVWHTTLFCRGCVAHTKFEMLIFTPRCYEEMYLTLDNSRMKTHLLEGI